MVLGKSFNLLINYVTNAIAAAKQTMVLEAATNKLAISQREVTAGMGKLTRGLLGGMVGYQLLRFATRAAIDDNFFFEKSIFAVGTMLNNQLGDPKSMESLQYNIKLSGQLMRGFEKDAIASAATLRDYVTISQNIAAPVLRVTKSTDDLRKMTDLTAAAATALGVDYESAAVGVQLSLAGAARNQNRLVRLLGIEAKTFNRYSPIERYKRLRKELEKFGLANEMFKKTAVGAWTSFKDIIGITLRRGIAPFFELFKRGLIFVNSMLQPLIPLLSKILTLLIAISLVKYGPALGQFAIGTAMRGGAWVKGAATRLTGGGVGAALGGAATPGGVGWGAIGARGAAAAGGGMGALKTMGSAALGWLTSGLSSLWSIMTALVKPLIIFVAIWEFLKGIWQGFTESLSNSAKKVTLLTTIWELLSTVFSFLGTVVKIILWPIQMLGRLIGGLLAPAFNALAPAINWITDVVKGLIDWIKMLSAWWTGVFAGFELWIKEYGGFGGIVKAWIGGGEGIGKELSYQIGKQVNKAMLALEEEKAGRGPPTVNQNIDEINIIQNFKENVNPDNVAMSLEEHLKRIAQNPVSVHYSGVR